MSNTSQTIDAGHAAMRGVPEPLARFAELFDRGEFWESHEVLEGAWLRTRSDFYQGLILYASAFVHVQRENPRGVVAQLGKTERRLSIYPNVYLGVDVAWILAHSRSLRRRLLSAPPSERRALLPTIAFPTLPLREDLIAGTERELTYP